MSNPRYTPAGFLVDGRGFGLQSRPRWVERAELESALRRAFDAAQLQHEWARAINAALRDLDMDLVDYAAAVGDSADRTSRVLRGKVIMRLEDIAAATRELRVSID